MTTETIRIAGRAARFLVVVAALTALAGCNVFTRLSEVGDGPELTQSSNPVSTPEYKPVSLPMPSPQPIDINPNSLWRPGAKAFFKDHRAKDVGDIVTVKLELADNARLENTTERTRDDSEQASINSLLGYEDSLDAVFPEDIDAPGLVGDFGSDHETEGDGEIDRSEEINLQLAAVITQVLPNGNLVIVGRQEVRVNYELRELLVTGIVRPFDIDTNNTVEHTKIAEMRVAYGGRGTLSDLQQPRWGMQVWDILFPF